MRVFNYFMSGFSLLSVHILASNVSLKCSTVALCLACIYMYMYYSFTVANTEYGGDDLSFRALSCNASLIQE